MGAGTLLALGGLLLAKREDRRLRALFSRMVLLVGGEVKPRRLTYAQLLVPHRERTVVLSGMPGGTGSLGGTKAGATVALPGALEFVLAVRSRDLTTRINALMGLGAVAGTRVPMVLIGTADFRDRFLVLTDAPDWAQRVLTPRLQMKLLDLGARGRAGDRTRLRLTYRRARMAGGTELDRAARSATAERALAVRWTTQADFQPLLTIGVAPLAADQALYQGLLEAARAFCDALEA